MLGRFTSLVIAVVGLIVLAPLMAEIALVIKLESPGPVFFFQDRLDRRGRSFRLVKFRTIRIVRTHTGSEWVTEPWNRITRVGRWLRRYRLNDLPMLVNVIRGDMNFIDPREVWEVLFGRR